MENRQTGISRRDFLKRAATGAVGVAAMGVLSACGSANGEVSATATPPAATEADTIVNYTVSVDNATTKAGYLTYFDWLGDAPVVTNDQIANTVEAEVVVVGGGNSGVCAALAAAEAGAVVAVVETQTEEAYTFLGHDIGTLNSEWVTTHGGESIDVLEFMEDWKRRNLNRTNPDLLRQYANQSGASLDWILSHLSDEVKANTGIFGNPYPKYYKGEISGYKTWASAIHFQGDGTDWPDAAKQLMAAATALRATWYFGQTAAVLVKDGNAVTGVIAQDEDGVYTKYTASKGVILSAGDFGANPAMVIALNDEYRSFLEIRGQEWSEITGMSRNGMGHKLGCWAGGHMEPGPRAAMAHANGAAAFGGLALLHLNCKGKRFMDEGILAAWGGYYQLMRQPRGNFAMVVDSKWREFVEYNALEHVYPGTGGTNDGGFLSTLETEIPKVIGTGAEGYKIRGKMTYAADTLEELADYLGYADETKENFLVSVARYNELCAKGVDDDYGKDSDLLMAIDTAPFYGSQDNFERFSTGLVELSGLVVDEKQNVLDSTDQPIKGLYATGNCCGGRYAFNYCTPIAGNSIGWATTMGKIVGEAIAAL